MRYRVDQYVLWFVVVVLIVVSLVDVFDLRDLPWFQDRTLTFILLLLSALTASWLAEQGNVQSQLDQIEKLVSQSAVHPEVIQTTAQAMDYLARRFSEAQRSIDQAAVAPSLGTSNAYTKYDQELSRVLKKNAITYRHITLIDDVRWKRVRSFLEDDQIDKYYVRYYEPENHYMPGLSYAVIDEAEVVMRYPYEPGQPALWISVKQPDVVRLFVKHFQNMWSQGLNLDRSDSERIAALEDRYGHALPFSS